PVPHFHRTNAPRITLPAVPAVSAEHRRVLAASVDRACVGVDGVDHRAPGIDVLPVARHEQRVAEADERARDAIAVLAPSGDWIDRAEPPAVRVPPPSPLGPAD